MNRKERRWQERQAITSQQEADETLKFLVDTTVHVMKLDRPEATKRVKALMKSGILESGHPDDPHTQRRIDMFLTIPSEKHGDPLPFALETKAYQEAFIYSIQTKELVEGYDRLTGSHLFDCMEAMQAKGIHYQIDLATGRTQDEIKKFEVFFREIIWSRFQHGKSQIKNN